MDRTVSACVLVILVALLCSQCVMASADSSLQKDLRAVQKGSEPRHLHRTQRFFFPIFTIQVPAVACNGSNGEEGTCYTTTDCTNNGGTGSGSCAGGYGVCCTFQSTCGQTTSRNNTFLVNDNYPDAFQGVSNCFYGIEKMNDNICQIRLDFVTMTLAGPETTNGECETDTLSITSSPSFNPPVICGENSGQHVYVDVPQSTSSVRINIATGDNVFDRNWRIKAAQIPCNSQYRAPSNCLQYYTEPTGTITSFNYVDASTTTQQLADQDYAICVRVQEGFCSIEYKETSANSFSISGDAGTPAAAVGTTDCANDYLAFITAANDRFCGSQFADVESTTRPFIVYVKTDAVEPATDIDNKGFSLDYSQNPC